MPPSEAMYSYWGMCNCSNNAKIFFLLQISQLFLTTIMIILGQNQQKYPCMVTEVTQPPIKVHGFLTPLVVIYIYLNGPYDKQTYNFVNCKFKLCN